MVRWILWLWWTRVIPSSNRTNIPETGFFRKSIEDILKWEKSWTDILQMEGSYALNEVEWLSVEKWIERIWEYANALTKVDEHSFNNENIWSLFTILRSMIFWINFNKVKLLEQNNRSNFLSNLKILRRSVSLFMEADDFKSLDEINKEAILKFSQEIYDLNNNLL